MPPIQGAWPYVYGKSLMAVGRLKSDNSLDTIRIAARLSTTGGVNIGSAPVPGANTQAAQNEKRPKAHVAHPYF
jgi:hypothetical protein